MPEDFENSPYFSKEDQKGLEPIDVESLSPLMRSRIARLMLRSPQANVQEITHMVVAERDGIAMERGISKEEAEKQLGEL